MDRRGVCKKILSFILTGGEGLMEIPVLFQFFLVVSKGEQGVREGRRASSSQISFDLSCPWEDEEQGS